MTQYDAGPGEWSDRPWDDPDKKPTSQARRHRLALPPWALLAILVAIVILLCVSLVLIIQAIKGGGGDEATATPTATLELAPTATLTLIRPTVPISVTNTVVLPVGTPVETAPPTTIEPGAMVVVTGTGGAGLRVREQPTTYAKILVTAREGTVLIVLEGPRDSDGYVWWRLRTPDGIEGWAAATYLVLKTEE
jgi:hypothetical protein